MRAIYHIAIQYICNIPHIFFLAKRCNQCKKFKDFEDFQLSSVQSDGHAGKCKDCIQGKYNANHNHVMQLRKVSEDTRRDRIREQNRIRTKTDAYHEQRNIRQRKQYTEKKNQREQELLLNPPPPKLTKICPTCTPPTEKPLSEFSKASKNKDGHNTYCKECQHKRANSEERKVKRREYMGQKMSDVRYREHKREQHHNWRQENAERLNEVSRQKYTDDLEYKNRLRRNTDKWHEENPLKRRENNHRYQSRKRQNGYEPVDYEAIVIRDNMFCYICQKAILSYEQYGFDHVIPVSKGGSHTAENIKLTHHICNLRKADKLLENLTPFQRRGTY